MPLSIPIPSNNRIEIADVLRGFAVMGITLIHFIERFSLNSFPEETNHFLMFTDRVIWDSVFFAFSGKAYCIFALLFGFSFFYSGPFATGKRERFSRTVFLAINSAFLWPASIRLYFPAKYWYSMHWWGMYLFLFVVFQRAPLRL